MPEATPDLTPIAELTAREQEVFMLMAHGDTNADITEELFISEGTVKNPREACAVQALHARPNAGRCRLVTPRQSVGVDSPRNCSYGG